MKVRIELLIRFYAEGGQRVARCVFAERRPVVYDLFAEILRGDQCVDMHGERELRSEDPAAARGVMLHSAAAAIGAVLGDVTRRNRIMKAAVSPNGIQQNR